MPNRFGRMRELRNSHVDDFCSSDKGTSSSPVVGLRPQTTPYHWGRRHTLMSARLSCTPSHESWRCSSTGRRPWIHIWIYVYMHVYTCTYTCLCVHICLYMTIYAYKYVYMYINIHIYIYIYPPAPMNHVKIFKGWPPRDAPSKLVQLWYKTFPPDQRGQVEMKKPTILSNKTSTAWSCVEVQILVKISGTGF